MNKNKIIFAIIGVLLLIFIFFVVLNLKKDKTPKTTSSTGVFTIWTIGDSKESFDKFIGDFKKVYPEYENQEIKVESFGVYDDYYYSLNSAIIADKAPDLFILNNNEKESGFANQVEGVSKDAVNPNDFRKNYKGVFADDLIITSGEGEQKTEFLAGIPIGYEALGIFYNRKYVKESELSSISSLNNLVAELKKTKPEVVPIGIGNGSTVQGVADIITQFFMLESGVSELKDVTGDKMKQSLASYMMYGDVEGDNAYNEKKEELDKSGKNSIDMFSKGDTFMVVGYPRLIEEIKKKGFSKNFLLASVFPQYSTGDGKTLINYNYFVINKDSKNKTLANNLLGYMASDAGAKQFLSYFKYYLPALLSLESDKLEEKISDDYNLILGNFYSSDNELSSFDKGVKSIYDKGVIPILDNVNGNEKQFDAFRTSVLCKAKKISTLEGLSESCDK